MVDRQAVGDRGASNTGNENNDNMPMFIAGPTDVLIFPSWSAGRGRMV